MRGNKEKQGLWHLLCVVLFTLLLFGCMEKKESLTTLVGIWDGYGANGEIVQLSVDEKNRVVISVDQAVVAGTYTVDLSAQPFHMVYELGEQLVRREALLDFLSNDTLQIEVAGEGESSPVAFTDACMILKRKS